MENKEKRGGYRPGSGRPKGSKKISNIRKAILDYTTPTELLYLVDRAKKSARKNDKMLQWYLEMCFGKPKVVERETTTNNIALFLDKLENKKLNPAMGDIIDGSTFGKGLETFTSLYNSESESGENTVQTEQSPDTLQPEQALQEHNS